MLESLITTPRMDHVEISKMIITVLSLFFIPYISILFGSTLFSLGFSFRGKTEKNALFSRFGNDLADTFMGNIGLALVLGILPVLTMMLCYAQILHGTAYKASTYLFIVAVNTAIAIALTSWFKNSFADREKNWNMHLLKGALALMATGGAIYGFVTTTVYVNFPEKWWLIDTFAPWTKDWNMVAKFLFVKTAGLAVTGAAIVFFFLNWDGGKKDLDADYRDYIRKFGGGIALAFGIIATVFLLWQILTMPIMTKNYGLYYTAMAAVGVMMIIALLLTNLLQDAKVGLGSFIFPMFILFFLVVLVDDHQAREEALSYQNYALQKGHDELMFKIEQARAASGGGGQPSLELGAEIYSSKCIACHQFDVKGVGPSYNSVLSKYDGDIESLKTFILNPVPVNPDEYPTGMANQNLLPHEAESAAMYLLETWNANK